MLLAVCRNNLVFYQKCPSFRLEITSSKLQRNYRHSTSQNFLKQTLGS